MYVYIRGVTVHVFVLNRTVRTSWFGACSQATNTVSHSRSNPEGGAGGNTTLFTSGKSAEEEQQTI